MPGREIVGTQLCVKETARHMGQPEGSRQTWPLLPAGCIWSTGLHAVVQRPAHEQRMSVQMWKAVHGSAVHVGCQQHSLHGNPSHAHCHVFARRTGTDMCLGGLRNRGHSW